MSMANFSATAGARHCNGLISRDYLAYRVYTRVSKRTFARVVDRAFDLTEFRLNTLILLVS